jgi:predicted membrane protein
MKMSASLIMGIFLILLGLSLVLKMVFHIDFPIFKIAFAGLFIYIGIKVIMGHSFQVFGDNQDEEVVFFGEKKTERVDDGKQYSVIFGGGTYDLSNYTIPAGKDVHIKMNTIFGGSKLILNKNMPVKINSNSVFGGTIMPNGNSSAFGSLEYTSDSIISDTTTHLIIESNTVFGGMKIVRF